MSEWKPIDTAPKDGREILIYAPSPHEWADDHQFLVVAWVYDWWHYAGCEYTPYGDPTHWMPLPEPPNG